MTNQSPKFIFFLAPLVLLILAILSIGSCSVDYVEGDINDIVYAEPTEEAKNFNIEETIKNLPQLEYEKKSYPVKETYTRKFNRDYELTVDVPEGYTVCPRKMEEYDARVEDTKGFKDSCYQLSEIKYCADNEDGFFWLHDNALTVSDDGFSIAKKCDDQEGGLSFFPEKSAYKGVSSRDIFMRKIRIAKEGESGEDTYGFIANDNHFLCRFNNESFDLFIDDNQMLNILIPNPEREKGFALNESYNIVSTVRVNKE